MIPIPGTERTTGTLKYARFKCPSCKEIKERRYHAGKSAKGCTRVCSNKESRRVTGYMPEMEQREAESWLKVNSISIAG